MVCLYQLHMISTSICLFVSLFVSRFSFHLRIFHSYGDVTIAGERLQILIYARHSWPLSSKGYLACHTYCNTGHPIIMVISADEIRTPNLPLTWRTTIRGWDSNTQPTPYMANDLAYCATAAVLVHDHKVCSIHALMAIEQWGFFSVPHLL